MRNREILSRQFRLPLELSRHPEGQLAKRLSVSRATVDRDLALLRLVAPTEALMARVVTIKGYEEPEPFREAALRQLGERGITARLEVERRRILLVAGKKVVGFGVTQYAGLGGKRRMGCGVLVPVGRHG